MNLLSRITLFLIWISNTTLADNAREGRITGAEVAEPHSNPYVVSLQSRVMWSRYRVCGGSIVSRRWILSAGHCVTDSFAKWLPMDAIVGAHSLKQVTSDMIYPITRRIAHPFYRGGVGPYDIGMMRTDREIEYSERVQPIMLPVTNTEFARNQRFLITGWGALQASLFLIVLPNKLREAEVTYLPFYECYRAINQIKDYYERNPLVKEYNICTGIPKTGSIAGCTGDSGGPLVQYVVNTGMVSSSQMPITTDGPSGSTTTQYSTTSSSPKPMTTNRPSTTSSTSTSTYSTTTTTDRPSSSPTPMTTDRPTSSSPIPMTTDRPSTMSSTSMEPPTMESPMEPLDIEDPTMETEINIDMTTKSGLGNDTYSFKQMNYNNNYDLYYARERMIPILVGVISWGFVPCGLRGAPTVYTNVSKHMDFIREYLYT